jgi:hypothetical protein
MVARELRSDRYGFDVFVFFRPNLYANCHVEHLGIRKSNFAGRLFVKKEAHVGCSFESNWSNGFRMAGVQSQSSIPGRNFCLDHFMIGFRRDSMFGHQRDVI